ncbi:MAG: hypothetical protein JNL01_00530 [Bdellovibrionales bacterium]|nr:hypothetical protein [Bdellovibrionales bacterium]
MRLEERNDVRPDYHFLNYFSAQAWPQLFFEQIPKRFLQKDPGFPILLRMPTEKNVPPWVYFPAIQEKVTRPRYYHLEGTEGALGDRILFIAHDDSGLKKDWAQLCQKYPAKQHRWITYHPENTLPEWPQDQRLDIDTFLLEDSFIYHPTGLVDLSFGAADTYSPIHIFCLSNGARLKIDSKTPILKIETEVKLVKSRPYGRWQLFI